MRSIRFPAAPPMMSPRPTRVSSRVVASQPSENAMANGAAKEARRFISAASMRRFGRIRNGAA